MARNRSRKTPPARTQSTPRERAEVVDEAPGSGWETGVAVTTGVILLVAILLVDAVLGSYGAGMFFK